MKARNGIKTFLALIAALLAALHILVSYAIGSNPEKKGYWWYIEDKPAQDTENKKERKPLPPPPLRDVLMAMHPDDLRDLREAYHKQAVWKPTPENVRDYYYVQDVIRRKALAMSAVTQVVMLQNPELNVARESPATNPGRVALTQVRQTSSSRLLQKFQNDYALLFFTQKGCPFCAAQRDALRLFSDQYGWEIKEIDKDDHPDLAARFGVTSFVPITILIERASDKRMPVAVGVESVAGIGENTYRAIRLLRGEITPEQFFTMEYQAGGVFDPVIRKEVYQ